MSTEFLRGDGYYYVRGPKHEERLGLKLKQVLGNERTTTRTDGETWEVKINEALLLSANFRPGSPASKLRDLFKEKAQGLHVSQGAELHPTPINLELD